ncbi:conserved protein of unknown function (plasmid) [Rhodovastum atsumiense]|uniref:Uncharacterized protein n=1 Tax=Rhodovastum atsumiense TaxID=504468 RepID=A0A5M6ITL0_9PROT|nr:hypothetical protein [Rhodovastum atsumiense]KAA5611551.1 hypothetical protein F1189_13375 [Rhodovastum atsumiense]CAH2606222.1 conserved protein of unknown function [Rhodovastum atsumiense]
MPSHELTQHAAETLRCLFMNGPLFDWNIPSEQGRHELERCGLAVRFAGWTGLTESGLILSVALGLHIEKDARFNTSWGTP